MYQGQDTVTSLPQQGVTAGNGEDERFSGRFPISELDNALRAKADNQPVAKALFSVGMSVHKLEECVGALEVRLEPLLKVSPKPDPLQRTPNPNDASPLTGKLLVEAGNIDALADRLNVLFNRLEI